MLLNTIIVQNDVEESHYFDVKCCWTDIFTYIDAVEQRHYV